MSIPITKDFHHGLLVASRYARQVVAVDLNPRAVRFARFNAQLNGVANFEVRHGSLYEVVAGERFDCILANPPFVPSPDESLKFRDGGTSGENILRNIIEGSDQHLELGGRLCIVTDLVDADRYMAKLRSWMDRAACYGLILTTADRNEILFSVPHCHAPFGQSFEDYNFELDRWISNFRGSNLHAVNFGYILVWLRPEGAGCDITRRTIHNPSSPIWEQVQDWIEQRRLWDSEEAGSMVIGLHPDLRMVTKERPDGEERSCELHLGDNPFFTTYAVSTAIADALRHIYVTEPTLMDRLSSLDADWVENLHRKGVLRLTTARHPVRARQEAAEKDKKGIEEHATKTTPTCLSSYLG